MCVAATSRAHRRTSMLANRRARQIADRRMVQQARARSFPVEARQICPSGGLSEQEAEGGVPQPIEKARLVRPSPPWVVPGNPSRHVPDGVPVAEPCEWLLEQRLASWVESSPFQWPRLVERPERSE